MNRVIDWFARNHVAANLLMLVLVAGGLLTAPRIKQEVFPEIDLDLITISVAYPGAAPQEVEEGVCIRIEEQLRGVDGVRHIISSAAEGAGVVLVELLRGASARKVLDDVKARIDQITTFPEEAEEPVIQQAAFHHQVIDVAVSGDADERSLKVLAQQVRDDLAALPGISHVELAEARPYEISIEVSETALRRYGLTFDEVARAVRRSSLDVPGGSVKAAGGEILLRTKSQAYRGLDFESLILISNRDGTRVTLGDIARVVDGFKETDQSASFDGKPAALVQVFRVGEQGALDIARKVKEYVRKAQARLPEGIVLTTWHDESRVLRGRLNTLLRNGGEGFVLVLALLALFLRFRLAFWVIWGVPLSFLGTLWVMPSLGLSINVVSLFAFILVLGILVDDAIVVGENIHTHQSRGEDQLEASITGAQEVVVPVAFGVFTTIAAFVPMLMLPGGMGKIFRVIPVTVIAALLFSLAESQCVLPAHLGHRRIKGDTPSGPAGRAWKRVQALVAKGLELFIERIYRRILDLGLQWRYLTLAVGLTSILLVIGILGGHRIRFTFFPQVEGDNVVAEVTMPQGAPVSVTAAAVQRLRITAREVARELEKEGRGRVFRHVLASVGEQPYSSRQSHSIESVTGGFTGSHLGEVNIELVPSEGRSVTGAEIARRWRERTGPIADAVELRFTSALFSSGEPINLQLRGPSIDDLRRAAARLKEHLAKYPGVIDISDSFRSGKREIKLRLNPSAETLGLTASDLGRQVRQAFYGEEAQRIQRGQDDVRVMVRYPRENRRSLADVETMRIRTPDGHEVPFSAVAEVERGRGFSTIQRADGQRIVSVTADIDPTRTNANEVMADLTAGPLHKILRDYPRLNYRFEGERREQDETLAGLGRGFLIALLTIYALLAVPLRSYIQPLIIMSAIPFGFVGAIWGHILMQRDLSVFSMIGVVALSGVVVNDSLVLVSFVNQSRAAGKSLLEAVHEAGAARFRPILLTSLTTFAGLTPLLMERSVQAQFLIPMAISLAFGVIFATFVSLMLVPALYIILEDLKWLSGRAFARPPVPTAAPRPAPRQQPRPRGEARQPSAEQPTSPLH